MPWRPAAPSATPPPTLRGALAPVKETHYAAMTDPKAVGALLRAMDGYRGDLPTRCALRLAPLTFVRPGELRKAEWAEFDLERGGVEYPRQPHENPRASPGAACHARRSSPCGS